MIAVTNWPISTWRVNQISSTNGECHAWSVERLAKWTVVTADINYMDRTLGGLDIIHYINTAVVAVGPLPPWGRWNDATNTCIIFNGHINIVLKLLPLNCPHKRMHVHVYKKVCIRETDLCVRIGIKDSTITGSFQGSGRYELPVK